MSGNGAFTYANGDRYEGTFKQGRKHGKGTIFYANGDKFEAEWQNGRRTKKSESPSKKPKGAKAVVVPQLEDSM